MTANLGEASTQELLDELAARIDMAHPEGLAYRTIGDPVEFISSGRDSAMRPSHAE